MKRLFRSQHLLKWNSIGLRVFILGLAALLACVKEKNPSQTLEHAMMLVRQGDTAAGLRILDTITNRDSEGRVGDEAALVLGNLLINGQQHAHAIPYLERAERGAIAQEYARLLLVKAIVEGGLPDLFGKAAHYIESLLSTDSASMSDFIREESAYMQTQLQSLIPNWKSAADAGRNFLRSWPTSAHCDEVRWLVAKALDQQGAIAEAYAIYAGIWYKSPSSAWAKQAHLRALELESSGKLRRRSLAPMQRYEFIQALQRAGLHSDAIEEADRYLAGTGVNRDAALFLKIISLDALKKSTEVIREVEEMRREHVNSKWMSSAALYAVKSHRRNNNELAIRRWVEWIRIAFRGSSKADEALYNLAVFLQNAGKEDEGLSYLEQLSSQSPRGKSTEDALWKMAWGYRRRGETILTVSLMRELLDRFPHSGYRKACLYWIARFTADADPVGARNIYQTLLRDYPNDYYGHEGLKNLVAIGGTSGQLGDGGIFPPIDRLDRIDRRSDRGYALAVNLKRVGLYELAGQELRRIPGAEEDPQLQFALADLYSRSGLTWESHEIIKHHFNQFMISGSRDSDLVPMEFWYICYPYNYRTMITKAIEEAGLKGALIEPALIAALIRLESRFKVNAISPVGAIGLMQLMPATAAQIAQQRGLAPPTRADLFQPEVNIRYGTFFLAERMRDFKGEWFPAICSYNAGTDPVRKWWAQRPPGQAMDEFIENIPYIDTRLYIKQVLGDYRNYEWIYKQNQR
ncbi:MAG: transglycosylase SLT domain-containing protein [Acidobacteria bacterium]|nr:transglycosylase SLT domain-containing protein [Acidobacteriota bacterium]